MTPFFLPSMPRRSSHKVESATTTAAAAPGRTGVASMSSEEAQELTAAVDTLSHLLHEQRLTAAVEALTHQTRQLNLTLDELRE